jgi:PAS domain S-box-containing protein
MSAGLPPALRAALVTAAVALAYLVTGKLGLMLAISPGYATAIFPASGIALAATLLWGLRGSIGAWVGSFSMNLWIALAAGSEFSFGALFVPACLASGALFQAHFGAMLVHRSTGFPTALDRERDIALFMLLGGPVGCVVSATFGVTALWYVNQVSGRDYLANWGNWWLGDTLGVLVVAPLVLAQFAEPRGAWLRRRTSLAASMLVLLGIVVFIYLAASHWEARRLETDFGAVARQSGFQLQQELDKQADIVDSIVRFYDSSTNVDADEFRRFAAPVLLRDPGIQSLQWVPLVTHADRAGFEALMRSSGYPHFMIRERDPAGHHKPAAEREIYFPVTYVEPWGSNEVAHGFDLGSDPVRRAAIEQAIAAGRATATARVRLVLGSGQRSPHGVLLFHPIYRDTDARAGGAAPHGFALGVLNLHEVVSAVTAPTDASRFEFELFDLDATGERRQLYPPQPVARTAEARFMHRHSLEFGGRRWEAHFTPAAAYMDNQRTWQAWTVLAAGLLLSSLIESYLLLVSGRSSRVEQLVEARTRELADANRSMAQHDRLLSAISAVQAQFISRGSAQALYDRALAEAVAISGSEYGVIVLVERSADGARLLKTVAMTDLSSDSRYGTCFRESAPVGMETGNLQSLLGAAVESGAPVIANSPAFDERRAGVPVGHPELRAYLGAPLRRGDEVVGVLGLANRAGGYSEDLVAQIEPLLNSVANVIVAAIGAQRRLEMERELAKNQELLSEAQRIAHVGHWDWNVRTNELTWSDERYRISGLDPGSIKPTYAHFVDAIHPDDRARVLERIQSALVNDTPYREEFRLTRADGEIRWVVGAGELQRDSFGQPERMVGVILDTTERKRFEHELMQARDSAERANRSKSEFLSNMSHELRTPMNAILGYAQLMAYDASVSDKGRAQLAHIQQAGEHLLNLINDVLDFSRIEAGSMSVFHEDVELGSLLREVKSLIRPAARARNIAVTVDDATGANVVVHADRTRLKQVVLNLLSNAVKYNRPNGEVDVRCAVIGERVRISVRDTGVGISVEKQQELFQPFNRLGQERGEVEGTGIGLVIARRLVELMSGTLGLHSTLGVGSTFFIDIACSERAAPSAAVTTADDVSRNLKSRDLERKVLYVEDNPANMDIVRSVIETFWPRASFLEAVTGELGVALALREQPDLILMDINLPGIDGYEALKRIRLADAGRRIPVYALTANALPADVQRGIEAGFSGYLTKPLDVPQFVRLVDSVLVNPAAARTPVDAGRPVGRRVLVAEDEAVNLEVLATMVQALGYEVDTCGTGREALAMLQRSGYGLVFMDCEMPEMTGYEASAAVRRLPGPVANVPIVAVSANAPADDAVERALAGFTDVLPKPVSAPALRVVIERYLGEPNAAPETAPDPVGEPAMNIKVLEQLRALLGTKTTHVVESLLTDVPSRLERLRNAIAANDLEAARREAHTMKGSSANLGAVAFARLCARINDACKQGRGDGLPAMCAEAADEFERRVRPTLDEFKRKLADS